jgi:hypothetical protein
MVLQYDPRSKQQSLQWKQLTSPRHKKACMLKSQMETVLITFFDIKGIIKFKSIPQAKQSTKLIMWK